MVYADVEAWTNHLADRLAAEGYREVPHPLGTDQPGLRAFRRRDFRVSWVLTQLHTFVVVQAVPQANGLAVLEFMRHAVPWAKSVKGGLPVGLQTGLVVIAVTATERAQEDAMHAATAAQQKMWAAMPISVVVDVAMQRAYTASGNMLWGAAYQDFLGEQQELIVAGTGAHTLASGGRHGGRSVLGVAMSVFLVLAFAFILVKLFG
jgi:hypothetical protein